MINYDKKFFRMMVILSELDAGKIVATSELAKRFNVSVRTVQRDMDLLNTVQYPIDVVDKGRYRFGNGFSLKKK